ncbi:alkaline phosphatase [Pontibacter harenae]|uniref:alkaline phosphatase n=1 Tax=Pontibacter harenae TaxID=2894083 RepID=UPI001E380FEE|nr:alkaline phosphatase [Pontibacter harenae]MCC9167871.1 alkaline phosphatase [Pontibacter harenae]
MFLKKAFLSLVLLFSLQYNLAAQSPYTVANIHAHNDYQQPIPLLSAYYRQVGSIEADIFLRNGELYVAHEQEEIQPDRTLESLYLKPLQKLIQKNNGNPYSQPERKLQLLLDLKTDGKTTLPALVKVLEKFPEISHNQGIQLVISGNKPAPSTWAQYPDFIHFDGNPAQHYSLDELKRVALFSDNFRKYTQWNGKGLIVENERNSISGLIDSVHHLNKKLRFWATPDNVNTWQTLVHLGVDYVGTDDVAGLSNYIEDLPKNEYQHKAPVTVYSPKYRNNDQRRKVKNVILLIGDGMGLAQIYAGYTAAAGQLNLFQFLNIGLSKTASSDGYITDSAAGATAMATGQKTNNRYIGVDPAGNSLTSIPELIAAKGMKSGIISVGDVTDATPASFYAHQTERSLSEAIAADFIKSPVDILIGGNYNAFSKRKDGQNLISQLQEKGYVTTNQFSALDAISASKFVVLDDNAVTSIQNGRGDFLAKSLNKSLEVLSKNKGGFFLMAEGAQIDRGGHQNNMSVTVQEMLDFDKAVGEAMKFVDEDGETLLIVTADHETGGLSLLHGDMRKGAVTGNFSTDDHTALPVPVFAYGPHSLDFRGVYENTALFKMIMQVINKYH